MCHFNIEQFSIFMALHFDVYIDESQVGEESLTLYRDELDDEVVSGDLLKMTPEIVQLDFCNYTDEKNEWLVCVASHADTNQPLFLICMKNGYKVYEEVLWEDEDKT